MESSAPIERSVPWQPITPRGVAEFARASLARLLVYQSLFALILAASVAWLLYATVYPSLETAIGRLPNEGEIRIGALQWKSESPVLLSEARVISVAVDLEHSGQIRVPSDIFVEFGSESCRVFSFAGFLEFPYLRDYIIAFNRPTLVPWWGAWRAPILALATLSSLLGLLLLWWFLATLYCPVALLIGFYANRRASLSEAWRLCAAAAMPAGVALWVGLLLYGTAAISLLPFILLVILHVVLIWIYAGVSVAFLPPDGTAAIRKNPFRKSA
jgi:hypothetical protein